MTSNEGVNPSRYPHEPRDNENEKRFGGTTRGNENRWGPDGGSRPTPKDPYSVRRGEQDAEGKRNPKGHVSKRRPPSAAEQVMAAGMGTGKRPAAGGGGGSSKGKSKPTGKSGSGGMEGKASMYFAFFEGAAVLAYGAYELTRSVA